MRFDERPYDKPPATNLAHRYALDWGGLNRYIPQVGYDPISVLRPASASAFSAYGFRKPPARSEHVFRGTLASTRPEFFLGWDGRFREVIFARRPGVRGRVFRTGDPPVSTGWARERSSRVRTDFFEVFQREANVLPRAGVVLGRGPTRPKGPRHRQAAVQTARPPRRGPRRQVCQHAPGDEREPPHRQPRPNSTRPRRLRTGRRPRMVRDRYPR